MAIETLAAPGPTPSCRCDYLTVTFKLPSIEACEELLNLGWGIGYHVLPNGEMSPPHKGKHFSEVRSHTSGVQVELTPPDKDVRNAGLGLLSIPGQVLSALETKERLNLYREVYSFEGFYRCTRIDTQFTVLEPPISIYDFVDEVSNGNIWAKNYATGQPDVQYDRAGNYRRPPTWYFGASDSPTRARIYSHGAKWDWSIPDIRFEVQQRKRNADDTFRALINLTKDEDVNEPLFLAKEANLVMAVSREKLDLRDTTGVDRERLGGKWLRKAPPVSWYSELVDAPGAPVERRARPVPTLPQSMEAGVEQYGGNVGAWILQTMAIEGCTFKQASEAYGIRCVARMRDMHRQKAKQGLTEAQGVQLDKLYAKYANEASRHAENCRW